MSNEQASLIDRLRAHALGPERCPRCGELRETKTYHSLELCTSEGQCDWSMGYGLHTDRLDDVFETKADMLEAAEELADYDVSFELRWNADMRAIKRWRAAHPGRELTWPDHADLCVWLLDQWDGLRLAMEERDGA